MIQLVVVPVFWGVVDGEERGELGGELGRSSDRLGSAVSAGEE